MIMCASVHARHDEFAIFSHLAAGIGLPSWKLRPNRMFWLSRLDWHVRDSEPTWDSDRQDMRDFGCWGVDFLMGVYEPAKVSGCRDLFAGGM